MKLTKSPQEIKIMQEGGKRLSNIAAQLFDKLAVGVTALEIDILAKDLIKKAGGTPSFMTVRDYQWATCISVNDRIVHGVPDNRAFESGDIISLDVGLLYQEFHTDTSWSIILGTPKNPQDQAFLDVGKQALAEAIAQATVGHRVGHISQAIQERVEEHDFWVVPHLIGHGVGKTLHEAPQVPGVLNGPLNKTPLLEENMVIAIEVIYAKGTNEVIYPNDDGWTLSTADGSLAGLFEHTVWISPNGPVILTRSEKYGTI